MRGHTSFCSRQQHRPSPAPTRSRSQAGTSGCSRAPSRAPSRHHQIGFRLSSGQPETVRHTALRPYRCLPLPPRVAASKPTTPCLHYTPAFKHQAPPLPSSPSLCWQLRRQRQGPAKLPARVQCRMPRHPAAFSRTPPTHAQPQSHRNHQRTCHQQRLLAPSASQ